MINENASKLIDLLGGTAAVARRTNVKPPSVSEWRKKGWPKDKLLLMANDIERLSKGEYTRISLFPDEYHLVWPDLAKKIAG